MRPSLRQFLAVPVAFVLLSACGGDGGDAGSAADESPAIANDTEPTMESSAGEAALHPLQSLGLLLSQGDSSVLDELTAYLSRTDEYKTTYAMEYIQDQYSAPLTAEFMDSELTDYMERTDNTEALRNALVRTNYIAHVDWKQESDDVLLQLDRASQYRLSGKPQYDELLAEYRDSSFGISYFLEPEPSDDLRELIESIGFTLEALDDGSDSYALILVPTSESGAAQEMANEAGIRLYFRHQRSLRAAE